MAFGDAALAVRSGAAAGLQPDPELWLDAWSRDHAYIPPEGNAEGGKYDLARTPFAAGVLRALSPASPTRRVVVMGASQLLKTQTMMNFVMGVAHQAPANILALMPNGFLAERLALRIDNTIKATPAVRDLFAKPRSRDGKNTNTTKTFRGGTLYVATAGSAANLAEIPARYLAGDEIDDWEADIQGQGDPIEVLENRASTFGRNAKIYLSSSPKQPAEVSKIYQLYLRGNRQHHLVPCPHCGHMHELVWANMRSDEAGTRAWMVCPECGHEIDEHHKTAMLAAGQWVARATSDDGTESFHISQLYAPLGWTSWLDLVRLRRAADAAKEKGDSTKLRAFVNTRLALCYDDSDEISTVDELHQRAQAEALPARVMPDQALVLTAFADTQHDRLEVTVEAWGPGLEHWTVDYQVLPGSPTESMESPTSVWRQLDDLVRTPYAHASGRLFRVSAYGIDSGGHNTQDVYNYAAKRAHRGCIATKGASQRGKPIIATRPSLQDVNWQGEKIADGVRLWMLGVDTAKSWLADRLRLTSGDGAAHWFADIGAEFFEGLLCERLVLRHVKGEVVRDWVKPSGARNEPLDCSVGNLAVAHYLGLHRKTQREWRELRARLVPAASTPDLFAIQAAAALPPDEPERAPAHEQDQSAAPPPALHIDPDTGEILAGAPAPAPALPPLLLPPPPPPRPPVPATALPPARPATYPPARPAAAHQQRGRRIISRVTTR